ncbi:MAG: DUF1499 domain-containing protein [Pseudomonadota bacterium]
MKAILIVVVVLVVLAVGGLFFLGSKSQSGAAPGLVDDKLAACPSSPNCVSSEAGTPDDKSVSALPASAWSALPAAISALGGTVTKTENNYLAAEFTSKTFKFVDDVEFRRDGDVVHVRSASRVGYSDAGANAARVASLVAQLAP